jgi:hypothetical protein
MSPLLPIREIPKTLEYSPGGDDTTPWLIEDWRAASEAFGLGEGETVAWHTALAGQGRPWLVIRRIFRINPLWGPGTSPDDLQAWTWTTLASSLGVPEKHLRADLEAALEFWKKSKLSAKVVRGASEMPVAVNPLDSLPDFQIHQEFTDQQIASLLIPFRFGSVRSAADRLYIANRIIELKKLLENKHTRESARTLIVMELNMASHESTLQVLKQRLESLQKSTEVSKEQSAETIKIGESITTTEKALTNLSKTYRDAASDLGGDEAEAGEVRRVALGTISHLIEAHRQYYLTGERALIDGMFAADEVVWLTTPLTIRPAQYRADIVLRMREAMIPENLWNADYKPAVIQREACRRMAKLVQGLTEEIEPPVIIGIDDGVATSDDAEESHETPPSEVMSNMPVAADYAAPAPRPDEPCMAM